jgi:ferritin
MKIIEILSEHIEEELDDALAYIMLAHEYKEKYPMIAKTFYELSIQEMGHMEMLHNDVKDIIEKHRKEHGEPPPAMLVVYEYLHKKDIEKANKIKLYQAQYREM